MPGREIPKEYREVAIELVRNQGWRYSSSKSRSTYPRLFPQDRTQSPVKIAKTPSDRGHGFKNWIAEIHRKGGIWPPEGR